MKVLSEQPAILHPMALLRARHLRSLTQQELATAAGLSRQQIINLEHGAVGSPTTSTVHSLAVALTVPAHYLTTSPGPLPPVESLHFRGKMRPPVKLVEELLVRGEHFERLSERLERNAQPPAVAVPEHRGGDPDAVERAAMACRIDWGLRTDNPIANVTRLLERAGALGGLSPLSNDYVEAFSWWRRRPFVLCRRGSSSGSRRRYCLAHELGHLVMHRHIRSGDRDIEAEANRFASAFLMPTGAFQREFPRRASRIDWDGLIEMKQRWGVSIQAILHRAHDLGVITASMYQSAYVRISQLGWRKQEPGEPVAEQPELVPNIVRALRAHGTSVHAIAGSVGFDVQLVDDTIGVDLHEVHDQVSDQGDQLMPIATVIDLCERFIKSR